MEEFITKKVNILQHEYTVKCGPGEEAELDMAVSYLNDYLTQHQGDNNFTREQLLLTGLLNLSHQFLTQKSQRTSSLDAVQNRLEKLHMKLLKTLEVSPA